MIYPYTIPVIVRQGLVAVDKAAMGDLPKIRAAMMKVQKDNAPTFT